MSEGNTVFIHNIRSNSHSNWQSSMQLRVCYWNLPNSSSRAVCIIPYGSRRFSLPNFIDNQHIRVAMLSSKRTGRLYTQETYCGRNYYVNKKSEWHNRKSNPRFSGLWRSASPKYKKSNSLLIYCVILQVDQNIQIGQLKYSAFEFVTDPTGPHIHPVCLPKERII